MHRWPPVFFPVAPPNDVSLARPPARPTDRPSSSYAKLGLLGMLERDMGIKPKPQRWQDETSRVLATLDVVICFEERIFDAVVEDLQCREAHSAKAVHVVCIDIKDDAENAAMGGQISLKLAQLCEASANLENDMAGICDAFEQEHKDKDIKMMYSVHYL